MNAIWYYLFVGMATFIVFINATGDRPWINGNGFWAEMAAICLLWPLVWFMYIFIWTGNALVAFEKKVLAWRKRNY